MFLCQAKCQVQSVLSKSSGSSAPGLQVPELVGRCLSKNEDQWDVCDGTALGVWRHYCLENHLGVEARYFSSLLSCP